MDLFQGSTPVNLIPFHLDKQSEENAGTPDAAHTLTPAISGRQSHSPQASRKPQGSPSIVDSEVDVNLLAVEMVRTMKEVQIAVPEESEQEDPYDQGRTCSLPLTTDETQVETAVRASTPVPTEG